MFKDDTWGWNVTDRWALSARAALVSPPPSRRSSVMCQCRKDVSSGRNVRISSSCDY
jgi:hypothetical protein